jgi:hypothetical protein
MRAAFPAHLGWSPSQYAAGSKSYEAPHLTICPATLTPSISCTNCCIGSRAMLPNYTSFSEWSLSVLNDFILTDSDFLLRAALWNTNLPISSLILLSQAWQVDFSNEFSQNSEGIILKKERLNVKTRWKRTGLYKNCRNHLAAFYTLLDTNLQELYTETRRTERETHKQEIRKTTSSIFCFASSCILQRHSCGWLTCPELRMVAQRNTYSWYDVMSHHQPLTPVTAESCRIVHNCTRRYSNTSQPSKQRIPTEAN